MTDDEIKAWLSDEERRMWAQSGGKPWTRHVFGQLAETRKALAAHEFSEVAGGIRSCTLCGALRTPHEPTCIFATMPRPR